VHWCAWPIQARISTTGQQLLLSVLLASSMRTLTACLLAVWPPPVQVHSVMHMGANHCDFGVLPGYLSFNVMKPVGERWQVQ
jgi:hypothetical protein